MIEKAARAFADVQLADSAFDDEQRQIIADRFAAVFWSHAAAAVAELARKLEQPTTTVLEATFRATWESYWHGVGTGLMLGRAVLDDVQH